MALTDNLTHYYKLDGDSNDAVGSNHGTDTSITYSSANGRINQGAGNISTGRISITNPSVYINSFTLGMWVKSSSASVGLLFDNGWWSAGINILLYMQAGGAVGCGVRNGGTYTEPGETTQTINDGNWHFVVLTADGSNLKLYLDATERKSGTSNINAQTNTGTFIGNRVDDPSIGFTGAIDEVGIWTRALSSTEITTLYNSGAGLQYPFSSTSIKTINGLAKASVKTKDGLAIASIKTINGLT